MRERAEKRRQESQEISPDELIRTRIRTNLKSGSDYEGLRRSWGKDRVDQLGQLLEEEASSIFKETQSLLDLEQNARRAMVEAVEENNLAISAAASITAENAFKMRRRAVLRLRDLGADPTYQPDNRRDNLNAEEMLWKAYWDSKLPSLIIPADKEHEED